MCFLCFASHTRKDLLKSGETKNSDVYFFTLAIWMIMIRLIYFHLDSMIISFSPFLFCIYYSPSIVNVTPLSNIYDSLL